MAKAKKQKYISAPNSEELERIKAGESFSKIKAGPLKKALDNDLSMSMDRIDESSEVDENIGRNNVKIRRGIYFFIGSFVTVMSIIGIIFTVNFCITVIKNIADNTALKNDLQKTIYPLVVIDAPTFEDNDTLPMDVVIASAAWDIIINGDKSEYETNFGNMTVPASDIEVHAKKLFGGNIDFTHDTVTSVETTFEYLPENDSYIIPESPHYLPYAPEVSDVKKISDDKYELKVEYYPPAKIWFPDEKTNSKPDKVMKYTLSKKSKKNYVIDSVDYYNKNSLPIS